MLSTARYAARTKKVTPISRTARDSRSSPPPRSCQTTTAAAKNSITESSPKPISAIEPAIIPETTATAASTVIQAMLAYSSQNPRRVSLASSAGARTPGVTLIYLPRRCSQVPRQPPTGGILVEMRLQILHVSDCPGAEALDSRLTPLLAVRADIEGNATGGDDRG